MFCDVCGAVAVKTATREDGLAFNLCLNPECLCGVVEALADGEAVCVEKG